MEFSASWIGPAYDPTDDLGVFDFWTKFDLDELPTSLIVHVSADPRYELRVNTDLVARGPQCGDPKHWFFDSVDIAPFLRVGENYINALVANTGWIRPMAQHSVRTAFLLDAEPPFRHISTSDCWWVSKCQERKFAMMNEGVGEYYIDVGPGEIFEAIDKDGVDVNPAHVIARAELRGSASGGTPWNLMPRTIPPAQIPTYPFDLCIEPVRRQLRKDNRATTVIPDFLTEEKPEHRLPLLPGQELLFDFGEIVVGYPSFVILRDGGVGGQVDVVYCESLVDEEGSKGDRKQTDGKVARGYRDCIVPETISKVANPFWIRTFRYISIITTVPLEEVICLAYPSGYPMQIEASFEAEEPTIQPIWDICVRTLKLCAGETYYDCPYYEQLQYIGDTRLQALIGYYLSRDRRLQRNAIEQFHWSMMENGLTQSRYPSRQMQVIPPFSLWWVVMIYDAWMHDPEFDPKPYLRSAQTVIESVLAIQQGLTDDGPFWNFGDWVPNWKWGVPPLGPKAQMHRILLQMAMWCYMKVSGLEYRVEKPLRVPEEANTEHAESLWRYWQVLAGEEPDPWDESSLVEAERCTYFWQYVKHVGMQPDDYVSLLDPWRGMIELGLTTTPETPEPTRSDCHGWSAHPPLSLLQIVAGVTSAAPGWRKVRIAPKPGSLERFSATVPHPEGDIFVRFENGKFDIQCPVAFEFVEP